MAGHPGLRDPGQKIDTHQTGHPAEAGMAESSEEIQDSDLKTPLARHRWGAIIEQVLYQQNQVTNVDLTTSINITLLEAREAAFSYR